MRKRLIDTGTVIFLASAVLAVGAGFFLGRTTAPTVVTTVESATQTPTRLVRTGEAFIPESASTFRDIVTDVMPSIVQIAVVDVVEQRVPGNPFDYFFGPRGGSSDPQSREFRRQGLGSGVIVRKTGDTYYALTNNHVVGEADEIVVMSADGRDYDATLIGTDGRRDLALVSFKTPDEMPVALLGNSASLMPGDWVLAMGSPLGFQSTVTAGIVSAVNRETLPGSNVTGFTDYIQTDAAINQGNSGGALVNLDGEVIGINTWIASPSGGSIGLGFAIPVNNARRAIDDFIVKGRVDYGWLGITAGDIDENIAEALEVDAEAGALVHGVFRGSPAAAAGIRAGDVITRIGDTDIDGSAELVRTVGKLSPGSRAGFVVHRAEDELTISVRLKSRGTDEDLAELSKRLWPGFNVAEVEEEIVVAAVNSDGPASGVLQVGDRISKVSGRNVENLADFYRSLSEKKRGEILFTIRRDESELIIGLVS